MTYCVTTKHPDPNAPRHLRILATRRAFLTLNDARAYAATVNESHDPAVSAWFGDTNSEDPADLHPDDKPRDMLSYGRDTTPRMAPVLCLPQRAAGCAPEHQPMLDAATRILGTGLPLSCLFGAERGDETSKRDGCDFHQWEYNEPDPAEQVYAVTVRVVQRDGFNVWTMDDSATDDGETFPPALLDYRDDIEQAAITLNGDPQDVSDGDEVCVYVPVSDDGEILTITDDEDEAADYVREDREQSRYGYPWAWGWAYHIDESDARYHADIIQRAGYVMAEQTATGETFAGIDGGGYNFNSAHRAPLGAYLMAKWGQTVKVEVYGPDGWPKPHDAIPVGPMIR